MDIIKEIKRLPNYIYCIDIHPFWIILGGGECKKVDSYDKVEFEILIKKLNDICVLYSKDNISNDDREKIAYIAQEIQKRCENNRLKEYYSIEQQDSFIQQLPQSEKDKIGKQIAMYKKAGEYYREYVLRR